MILLIPESNSAFGTPAIKAVHDKLKTPEGSGAHIPHGFLERATDAKLGVAGDKFKAETPLPHRVPLARIQDFRHAIR
jgi:hypothetical protein